MEDVEFCICCESDEHVYNGLCIDCREDEDEWQSNQDEEY